VALAVPLPLFGAEPPIVFQTTPIGQILDDARAFAKLTGGEQAVKEINEAIKEKLGEKGFEGIDLERPILGYVVLDGKLEDVVGVIAIPVTSEKEFLGLYERIFSKKLEAVEKGLYEFKIPEPGDIPIKIFVRFQSQHAYVAIGKDSKAALSSQALVPPAKLFDPSDKSFVSLKVHFDRLPKEIREEMANGLKELKNKLNMLPLPPEASEPARKAVDEMIALGKRYADLLQDAKTATARIILDVKTSETAIEFGLIGKPGSNLAKSIAERKPSTNKFAGLIGPDTVVGLKLQLPLFAKEIQNAAIIGLEAGQKEAKQNAPEEFHAAIDEAFKGLIRTVKDGEFDLAVSLRGPDKMGFYTVVGAIAFEDPSALEKELRVLLKKDLPPFIRDLLKLDAAKVGKTSIHEIKVGGFLPPEAKKIFSEEASVALALAPNGIFVTFGPDSVSAMKTALEVKKAPSPVLEVALNPKRLGKLISEFGVELPEGTFTEDKLISSWAITIEGGNELRLRLSTNMKGFEGLSKFGIPGAGSAKPAQLKKE
jgi:hypothetical protein